MISDEHKSRIASSSRLPLQKALGSTMPGLPIDRGQHEGRHESSETHDQVVSFGPFRLFAARRFLERDGTPVRLSSRALDILVVLVAEAGKVVSKSDLIARAWPGITVDEANIRVQVAALRKALGDGATSASYISTIPGTGYCFVAPIFRAGVPASTNQAFDPDYNLPPKVTRIFGRDQTVGEIVIRLKTERFLTIVGPGGIGKTTVAVSVGHELNNEFGGAVYLFDLGLLSDPLLIPGTIAVTLGIPLQSADLTTALINHLRDKRTLLIFDSCEHVIETVATLAERIFANAPQVHILATSRESLRVEGEHIHRLPPLASPPDNVRLTATQVLDFPAVQLFMERAIAGGRRQLTLTDTDVPIIGEICRRLDGIALAIQLAAARANAYGMEGTLSLLKDRFELTWEGRRTARPRHHTLRATLDWSYDLLPQEERLVLRRLSVFVGTFTLEAACAVATDEDLDDIRVAAATAALVGKSLVEVDKGGTKRRYRLLDTTRTYAAIKLGESGELDPTKQRHAIHYREVLERHDSSSLAMSRDLSLRSEVLGNARGALDWSLSSANHTEVGVSLAALVAPFLAELSLLAECHRLTRRALGVIGEPDRATRREMELQASLGSSLMLTEGYREDARIALMRALDLAEVLGDPYFQMRMLRSLHNFHIAIGDFRKSFELAQRNEEVARKTNDPAPIAVANWMLGLSNYFAGNQLSAERSCESLLADPSVLRNQSSNFGFDSHTETRVRCALAAIRWFRGFPDQAVKMALETIHDRTDIEHPVTLSTGLVFSGFMFVRIGNVPVARGVIERLIAHCERHSLGPHRAVGIGLKGVLDIHHGDAEEGVEMLGGAISALQADRYELHHPALLGSLAEGLAKLGRSDDASATIDDAIARVEDNGQAFILPELLRIKGVILASADQEDLAGAERLFQRSLKLADVQHALSWELRTAMSFAELWIHQGRQSDGCSLLAAVFNRFTEGFDSSDLKAAKALLGRLRATPCL
ncbi:putative ATPase/DNA-binding winged helix-turn-helix (wHTH) protein [Bradyrhizobium sp. LA8.1]|uniref:ATP-binding protein n=1 Tax=unclassified Bradyrhizobium TaxID=2631580 RepID=UPI0033941B66